jgi:cobalt/nickel transport system ATP-binding protein
MVYELCERTIILKDGRIIADGLTSELMINEELMEKCSLEIPLSMQNCPRCGAEKLHR